MRLTRESTFNHCLSPVRTVSAVEHLTGTRGRPGAGRRTIGLTHSPLATVDSGRERRTAALGVEVMDWKIELIPVQVTGVDRAKS